MFLLTVPSTNYHTWNSVSQEWDIDMNGEENLNISFKLSTRKLFEVLNIKGKPKMRDYDEINL